MLWRRRAQTVWPLSFVGRLVVLPFTLQGMFCCVRPGVDASVRLVSRSCRGLRARRRGVRPLEEDALFASSKVRLSELPGPCATIHPTTQVLEFAEAHSIAGHEKLEQG